MNYAHLKILGITVPIGNHNYYDDGFIESIIKHSLKLDKKYGVTNLDYDISYAFKEGLSYQLGINHHIFYLKQPRETGNIRIRAHEETHVLDHLGRLDILEEKLLKEQRIKINFREIDEKEVKAELGSLYALYARRIFQLERWLVYSLYGDDNNRRTAKRIYKQSKLPRKMSFLF